MGNLKASPVLGTLHKGKYVGRTASGEIIGTMRRAASIVKNIELMKDIDIWGGLSPQYGVPSGSGGAGSTGEWMYMGPQTGWNVPAGWAECATPTCHDGATDIRYIDVPSCVGLGPCPTGQYFGGSAPGFPDPAPNTQVAWAVEPAGGGDLWNIHQQWEYPLIGTQPPRITSKRGALPEDILDPFFGHWPEMGRLIRDDDYAPAESRLRDDWDRMSLGDLMILRGGERPMPGPYRRFEVDSDFKFRFRPSRRLAYHVIGVRGRVSFVPRGDGDVEIWSEIPSSPSSKPTTRARQQVDVEPAGSPVTRPVGPPLPPPPRVEVGYVDMVPRADVKVHSARKFGLKVYHALTEVNDATAVLAASMPDDRCERLPGFAQAACVLNNFALIDWKKAVPGLVYNEIEDRLVGRVSGQIQKLTNRVDWHGPSGMQVTQFSRQMRTY